MIDMYIPTATDLLIKRSFILEYYNLLDEGDRSLLKHLYDDASYLNWNWGISEGVGNIKNFVRGIPHSKHYIHTNSIHPVPASADARLNGQQGYRIAITGTVEFGRYSELSFTHDFLITYNDAVDLFKIVTEKYRVKDDLPN